MAKVAYKPMLAVTEKERTLNTMQSFKGEVMDIPVKFPKGLGAEHPFEFEDIDKVLKKVGIVAGGVNKIVDEVVGDFQVRVVEPDKVDEKLNKGKENAQAILDSFIEDSNLKASLKPWAKEGISKGNGFMEIDLEEEKVRVMNANNMFVKRNKKGKVIEFNQFKGKMAKFTKDSKDRISFKPKQIAHLTISKVPNDPYGIGMVFPSERVIENIVTNEEDMQKLIGRKAGAPIHVKLGVGQAAVQQEDIDKFKANLQFMQNSTEWVTDSGVEMTPIDFSGIGDNFLKNLDHNMEVLAAGMEIPLVLFGKANVPEGLAKAQKGTFAKKIQSIRESMQIILEEQVFRPILLKNDMDAKIEFIWDLPTNEDKNLRLTEIQKALGTFDISPTLKAALEIEYATVLGLEDVAKILIKPEDAEKAAEDARKEEEKDLKQPEVPGAKPTAKQKTEVIKEGKHGSKKKPHKHTEECNHEVSETDLQNMTVREFVSAQEIPGFNYSDYLISILKQLKVDKFEMLRAVTEKDVAEGLLTGSQITRLNSILKDGFRRNKTMRKIEADIKSGLGLKDRKVGEKVILTAEARPSVIARTEVVRLSNLGLKDMYKENGIEKYRYLAALDARTSDICNSLNGQVFLVSQGESGVNMPPMHVNCRSTIVGLIE